jgi:peptide/nickel transport system ATP-binding protein
VNELEIHDLVVRYGGRRGFFAVDGVSLTVPAGGTVALVGESGAGKSTVARAAVGMAPIFSGQVLLGGECISSGTRRITRRSRMLRRDVQLTMQDPFSSLDPRMTVGESIAEGVSPNTRYRSSLRARVHELLSQMRLEPEIDGLFPHQLSGGQRQRVGLARALAADPRFLIADEITSALDASVQAAVLNLLVEVKRSTGMGILLITHNLAVARYLADTIAVMRHGRVVETADTEQLISQPKDPYTRELLAAVPNIYCPKN